MILEIKTSKKNLDVAKERANNFAGNKFTITQDGKLAGFLCEQIFVDNFGGELVNSYNYDILLNGLKIDIKTKRCSSEPLGEYTCSVSAYQKDKQDCDYYVFFRALNDLSKVWVLGAISKEEFFKKATFVPKGTRDGRFVASADMYSMKISDLDSHINLMI